MNKPKFTADCIANAFQLYPYQREFLKRMMKDMQDQINRTIRNGIEMGIQDAHGASVAAGWYNDPKTGERIQRNKGEMLCLIHSEVSEMMEGARKGLKDDHLPHRPMEEVEAADVLIRLFDYCGAHGLDLAGAYIEKRQYNNNRADHKLENRAKEGGKAF